jgi:hypothetical protein
MIHNKLIEKIQTFGLQSSFHSLHQDKEICENNGPDLLEQ